MMGTLVVKRWTIFAKSFSIDIWQCPKYASASGSSRFLWKHRLFLKQSWKSTVCNLTKKGTRVPFIFKKLFPWPSMHTGFYFCHFREKNVFTTKLELKVIHHFSQDRNDVNVSSDFLFLLRILSTIAKVNMMFKKNP